MTGMGLFTVQDQNKGITPYFCYIMAVSFTGGEK
jgi:hypothetical protein